MLRVATPSPLYLPLTVIGIFSTKRLVGRLQKNLSNIQAAALFPARAGYKLYRGVRRNSRLNDLWRVIVMVVKADELLNTSLITC